MLFASVLWGAPHFTAFVDVNVVPMDSETVSPHQTVVVRDDRIVAIGPVAKIKPPIGVQRIDGRGKYLMPGLTDMHVHILDPILEAAATVQMNGNEFMAMFLANGVTSVRAMWGTQELLLLQRRVLTGDVPGPYIYSAGPVTDGDPPRWRGSRIVTTPEEAFGAVVSDKRDGFVGIKVYNRLSAESYSAIVAAARKQSMPVYGHVPRAVGLMGVLAAHQDSIEHLDGFIEALQADDSPFRTTGQTGTSSIDHIDLGKLPALVDATRAAGAWNCPTIVVRQGLAVAPNQIPARLARHEMQYLPAWLLALWTSQGNSRRESSDDYVRLEKQAKLSITITKALHEIGAGLLLGTDTPNPFVVPGFSIHEELENLVQAGMTPYQALKAGTRDAAEFLKLQDEFGTVAVGRRADLLLLERNPLANVQNTGHPVGVMARGRWFSDAQLESQLQALANKAN
ncbi:MAG TPA: amidohydrolase family protein [Bryobacteraceae bacterium]|nr:amidohydrolase family protein [Bryobacteraceae bacterium]